MLILLCRMALSAALALAGATKLRNREHLRGSLSEFGLPRWAIPLVSASLPLAELVGAALLLFDASALWGAVAALALLMLFSAAIALALWRGRRPSCACFGALSAQPIGPSALLRNGALMALAGVIALRPDFAVAQVDHRSATITALVISTALLLIVAGLGWLHLQLWRQQGRLLLRIEQLEGKVSQANDTPTEQPVRPHLPELLGKPLPALELRAAQRGSAARNAWSSAALRGAPALLVFADADCQHCRPILARLATWKPDAQVLLISPKADASQLALADGVMLAYDPDGAAMHSLGLLGTPAAIAVDANGIVTQAPARGLVAVSRLLDQYATRVDVNDIDGAVNREREVSHEFAAV